MVTSNIQKYNKIVETELLTIKKKIIEKKNKLTNNIQKNALYKLNKSITITETALKQITGLVNNISTKSLGDVQKIIKNAKAELTKGNKAAIQTVRKKIMQIEQRIRKEKRELLKKKALLLKQLMKTTYASAQYFLTMAATSNKQIQAIVKSINNIKQKLKDINKITKSLNQYITTIFEEVYNAKNFINEILLVVEKSKKELKDLIDEIEKGYHEKSQHIFKKLKRDLQFIYGIEKDIHKRLKNLNIFLDKLQAIQVKFNRIYELIQKEQLVIFKHFKPIQTLNIQKIKRIPIQIALSLKKLQREVLKFKTLKKDLKNIYTFIQNKAKETVKDGKLVMKKVKNLLTKVGKQSLKIMKWAFFNKLQNIIKIDYANITSPDGIRSHIKVKYHYLENFSTEFLFRYDSRKETSTIAGLSNSILNTSQKNYLLDLYLLQYKHTIIPNKLNVDFGIAANVLNLNNEEKGNFTSGPNETIYSSETKSQEYENKYTIWIYSPRIWFSSSIDFDFIKSNISIDYSPLFFYDYKQTTFISPLVNSGARHTLTFRDNGESYFMGKIALVFFNLIGFEANYEYYRMKFYQITLQSDISTGSVLFNFAPIKSYYAFTDTSLIVNIYYPLFNSLTVKFGVGKRYLKTINDSENQIQNKSDELIINFGLTSTI